MLSQQNFLFQRHILLLINCPHVLFLHFLSFQETFIEKCSSKFKFNTLVMEGKKMVLEMVTEGTKSNSHTNVELR